MTSNARCQSPNSVPWFSYWLKFSNIKQNFVIPLENENNKNIPTGQYLLKVEIIEHIVIIDEK